MGSWGFAPRVTQMSFSGAGTTQVEVENGDAQPIRIWGYAIANTTAGAIAVTLRSGTGATDVDYAVHSIGAGDTIISDISWIADKGLEVNSAATGIEVSIFHSAPGS